MKIVKFITQTIIDGLIIFLLVMALIGYSEAIWPYDPVEARDEIGCKFPCKF